MIGDSREAEGIADVVAGDVAAGIVGLELLVLDFLEFETERETDGQDVAALDGIDLVDLIKRNGGDALRKGVCLELDDGEILLLGLAADYLVAVVSVFSDRSRIRSGLS